MMICKNKCDKIKYPTQDLYLLYNAHLKDLKISIKLENCTCFNKMKVFKYCAVCESIFLVLYGQRYCQCCSNQLRMRYKTKWVRRLAPTTRTQDKLE